MTANLLPQLRERTAAVEKGELSGKDLENEIERLGVFVDGLKERVEKLPQDQTRSEYLKTVNEAYAELKSAKPKDDEKPSEAKSEDKKNDEKKDDKDKDQDKKKTPAPAPANPAPLNA